ncbi:MAG: hypothetical protein HY855_25060 [Burkholderiales bacterium]|nr:hypothetical protein [Burkholderiales bacterium]
MFAATYLIAYSIPMVLLVWGIAWALMIRRKGIALRAVPVLVHLAVLVSVVAGLNAVTGKDTGMAFLATLILAIVSCSILRSSAAKAT